MLTASKSSYNLVFWCEGTSTMWFIQLPALVKSDIRRWLRPNKRDLFAEFCSLIIEFGMKKKNGTIKIHCYFFGPLFLQSSITFSVGIAINLQSFSLIITFGIRILFFFKGQHRNALSLSATAILSVCAVLSLRTRAVILDHVPLRWEELDNLQAEPSLFHLC